MLLEDVLTDVVKLQDESLSGEEPTTKRDLLARINVRLPHALIISGIRRCGKSTLLKQLIQREGPCNYFNFDDHRAVGFELSDFNRLDRVFASLHPGTDCYCFDEIQNVPGWERFVRGKLDEGKRFVITGSNASLLSRELGTRLTGRHVTYELFPFSYTETLRAKDESPSVSTFKEYLDGGGFPEYVKYGSQDLLQQLFSDIINRDIIVRYGLRNAAIVKKIALYLLSNVGNEFTYTGLSKAFDVGSPHSIIDYISYYEDSYLLFSVPRFSYKFRQQQLNPKKIYGIDTGFIKANTISFTTDDGRLLENAIFLQLRRTHKPDSIFYYKGKNECDFIVVEKNKPQQAIQVCHKLTEDNLDRELRGVKEAMAAFKLEKGLIVTMDQEDHFENVEVMPAWKWMSKATVG